jgi:hypothetical protein
VGRDDCRNAFVQGDLEGEIAARYPSSQDARWYLTPKPEEDQEAIFVLHRDGLLLGDADLAILHESDVIPAEPEALDRYGRLA